MVIGPNGRTFINTAGRDRYLSSAYFGAVNAKFSRLRIKMDDYKSPKQLSLPPPAALDSKTDVLIADEVMIGAGSDEAMATRLEKRLKELPAVSDAIVGRFDEDSSLVLRTVGFSIDKKGEMVARGAYRKDGGKDDLHFKVRLGNLSEKTVTLMSRFEREFDKQAFGLDIRI
ncbi:MAG: hypothetical protein LBU86_04290 [Oscillospiraceae bacterium]|nr:hypothetical protein [Oscillospiraceae bacterium]